MILKKVIKIMNNIISTKRPSKLGITLITCLMLFSTLCSSGLVQFLFLRNAFLILNVCVFLFVMLVKREKIMIKISLLKILWVFFSLTIMVSIWINNGDIFWGLTALIIVPILYFDIIPSVFKFNLLKAISYSMAFSNGLIILYSIMNNSVKYPFLGILKNPNTMGVVILGEIVSIMILFTSEMEYKERYILLIFYIFILLLLFLLLIVTGSRTSLSTAVIVILALLFNSKIRSKINLKKILLFILIVSCLCYIFFSNIEIIRPITNKNQSSTSFLIRLYIWTNTVKESKLFGFGDNYFYSNYSHQSHSSYIDILGRFGIIAFLIFIAICVFSFRNCYKYRKLYRDIDEFSYAPFIISLAFLVCSLAETLFAPVGHSLSTSWMLVIAYMSVINKSEQEQVINYKF